MICGPHVMSGGLVVFVYRTSFDSVGQSVMSWLLWIYQYLCKQRLWHNDCIFKGEIRFNNNVDYLEVFPSGMILTLYSFLFLSSCVLLVNRTSDSNDPSEFPTTNETLCCKSLDGKLSIDSLSMKDSASWVW